MESVGILSLSSQVVYSKRFDVYGLAFKSVIEAMKFLSKQPLLQPVIKIFMKKGRWDQTTSRDERILIPLKLSSSNLMIKVEESDLIQPRICDCQCLSDFPLEGCPAVVRNEIGVVFEDYMQFTYAYSALFDDLKYEDDPQIDVLEDQGTYLFFSLSKLFSSALISLQRVPHSMIGLLLLPDNISNSSITLSAEKANGSTDVYLLNSTYSIGHTTTASSVMSADTLTPVEDVTPAPSVKWGQPTKKKYPINQQDVISSVDITNLARQMKISILWKALLSDGWVTKEAGWSNKWWSCELVYIPPWNSAGLPDHSKWKVGRDFFWFVEDIAAYITKYGYDDRNPTNVLPKENFLHDFDDPSWSIDRRIVNIALEGSRVERERLPLLLQRSGWKILSRDSNKKRQDIAYIPAWNADTINWDTMVNYTLNFDFFKELDEVEKHLKRFGNAPAVQSRSSPVCSSSPREELTETIHENILSNITHGCKFSDIWHLLQDLGWRNVHTDTSSWHIGSSVYIPSWEVRILSESLLARYPASEKVRKRDYFCEGDEVISYLKKYGFTKTSHSVTPPAQIKRNQKTIRPSNETIREYPSSSMLKPTSASGAKNPNQRSSSTVKRNVSVDTEPSPELSVEVNIMRILMWDPTKRYQFAHLWEYLKLYGWKVAWSNHDQFYIPHWTNLRNKIKGEDLSGLVRNVDFFDHKDAVIDYLKKWGLKRTVEPVSSDEFQVSRNHQSKTQQHVHSIEIKSKKLASHDSKKRTLTNGPTVPQKKRAIDDPELRRILSIDQSKQYLFPELWAYLAKMGWKYVSSNDPLQEMVYIASWVNTSTPLKRNRFNLSGNILNVDYFVDTKDIINYVMENGLRRIPTNEESHMFSDESKTSTKSESNDASFNENTDATCDYGIRLLSPKRQIRGRESTDFDPYSAFELLETTSSPMSPADDNTMTESYITDSVESSVAELSSWIGQPCLEVVVQALSRLDSRTHANCLIGRSKEFEYILSIIENSRRSGIGCNILLHGQPGQGKSQMVKSVIAHYRKINGPGCHSSPIDVVFIQGTAASNSNDVFTTICESLNLDKATSTKEAVLQRFRSDAIISQIDSDSNQDDYIRSSKKQRSTKKVPMTLIVIEEAYQANLVDIRTIMELVMEGSSSAITIGVFNNRSLYDSLRLNEEAFTKLDVEVYPVDSLEKIANHYLSGIADDSALRFLAMSCYRSDNSDVRALIATCGRCLQDLKAHFENEDVQKIYDGTPILSNQFVRKTTSTLNSSMSTQQQETIRSMDAVNARILSSMILASIGITSPASIPDIRAGYEAYTNQLSLTHIGDSVEQRLDALSEQRLLSRAGIKFKKLYKLEVTAEDFAQAIEFLHPIYYRNISDKLISSNINI